MLQIFNGCSQPLLSGSWPWFEFARGTGVTMYGEPRPGPDMQQTLHNPGTQAISHCDVMAGGTRQLHNR